MQRKAQEKIERIQELLDQKRKIDTELEGLVMTEAIFTPMDFVLNDEVLNIIREAGQKGIAALRIWTVLKEKYPIYGIDRKKIASSLAYLKNRKRQIVQAGRGIYRIVTEENTG